jgi:hypothetical protein
MHVDVLLAPRISLKRSWSHLPTSNKAPSGIVPNVMPGVTLARIACSTGHIRRALLCPIYSPIRRRDDADNARCWKCAATTCAGMDMTDIKYGRPREQDTYCTVNPWLTQVNSSLLGACGMRSRSTPQRQRVVRVMTHSCHSYPLASGYSITI